jgi:hypothetical protein
MVFTPSPRRTSDRVTLLIRPFIARYGPGAPTRPFVALAALAALLVSPPLGAQVLHGQPARPGDPVAAFSRVTLEPLRAAEVFGTEASASFTMGPWHSGGVAAPTALRVDVARQIPAIWRMRLPDGQLAALDVSCTVTGADGRPGRLTSLDRPDAEIAVTARALPPSVVDRDDGGIMVEGGAELLLRIDAARVAGRYAGTLTVTVNQL